MGHAARRRNSAVAIVGLLLGLIVWGLLAGAPERPRVPEGERGSDLVLYETIVDRMNEGHSYYSAVAAEQPAQGYPTRPVMTVREPTVAWLITVLGGPRAACGLLLAIVLAASVSIVVRLRAVTASLLSWVVASILAAMSLILLVSPGLVYVHEMWAGALIVLSVAVRTGRRWAVSVVAGLAAALVRELAVPYLLVMLVMAVRQRRPREALAWGVAVAVWAGFYALHAIRVMGEVPVAAATSPGWLAVEGWPLFVEMIRSGSVLVLMPFWVAALLVPFALAGWWTCRSSFSSRVALTLTGYAVAFMFIGRANTVYWGFMLAALLVPGLAMIPHGLRVLGLWLRPRDFRHVAEPLERDAVSP